MPKNSTNKLAKPPYNLAHPTGVCRPKPSDFGLFDVLGDAMEWCQNRSVYYPTDHPLVEDAEQVVEVRDNELRVLRGGSFLDYAPGVRSANRANVQPANRANAFGFRVARTYP
jgi:formylglycine-generating enzyme required for sulfatase activity